MPLMQLQVAVVGYRQAVYRWLYQPLVGYTLSTTALGISH